MRFLLLAVPLFLVLVVCPCTSRAQAEGNFSQVRIALLAVAGHPDVTSANPYAIRFWPNVDAVFVNLGAGQAGTTIRRIRESGLKQQLFASYFATLRAELDIAGSATEGMMLVEMDYRKPVFVAKLKELFPETPP